MKNYLKILNLWIILIACASLLVSFIVESAENQPLSQTLKSSWETVYPYQYLKDEAIPTSLTGLDIELVQTLSKALHQTVAFKPLSWQSTLVALKRGTLDVASGATYSKDRENYVFYSIPYRFEESSLFVLKSKSDLYKFKTIEELQSYIRKNKFRLGVRKNALNTDEKLKDFINNPENSQFIIYAKDEQENLNKLLENKIDGFLADRMIGSALIWHTKNGRLVSEHDLKIRIPIHLIFSKKTISKETVAAFNEAINKLRNSTLYENIISWYLYPVILLQTVNTDWFKMIDILGTLFFAISGVLLANALNASFLSALIYAILPSLGGGLLRDVIFNQRPVGALLTPLDLLIVCCTVSIGFLIIKIFEILKKRESTRPWVLFCEKMYTHFELFLTVSDALGLAAFTVTGVMISLVAKADPLWLWGPFFAFLTGAAGTIIRDILSKSGKLDDIEGEIYSEVAILWGLFLSVGLLYNTFDIQPTVIQNLVLITVIGSFVTRMLVYFYKVPNVYFK